MRHIISLCVPCVFVPYLSHYLINNTITRKEAFEHNISFFMLFTNISVSFSKTNSAIRFHKCTLCKTPVILVRFRKERILLNIFLKCSSSVNLGRIDNDVTIVVHCYYVGSTTQKCGKSDINECYCVEQFFRILKLELICVRKWEIAYYLLTFFKFSCNKFWTILP